MGKRLKKEEIEKYIFINKDGNLMMRVPAFDVTDPIDTVDVEFFVKDIDYIGEDYIPESSKYCLFDGSKGATSIYFFVIQNFSNLTYNTNHILVNVPCNTINALISYIKRKQKHMEKTILPLKIIPVNGKTKKKDPPTRWDLLDI